MTSLLPLTAATLPALEARVAVPRYRREKLTSGVVHLGVGNFHRAHQTMYFERLADLGAKRWGVTGVNLRSSAVKDALSAQDNLFLVVSRDGGGARARVVGALLRCLYLPTQPRQALAALSSPRTHLVTLTITGNGYPVDGGGSLLDGDVQCDLEHPERPSTTFGYLVEGLNQRRLAGAGGLTVLSCDNLPDSGAAAMAATVQLARRRDPGLASWIEDKVRFPNAMVDRITPATTPQTRAFVSDQFHVTDRWPVLTESFSQWVVEDRFASRRPPLDEVGVQYVSDVAPYKLVKTRLLNGGHCALGYLGLLSGYLTSSEAMRDRLIECTLRRLLLDEVSPLLPSLPGSNLHDYSETVLERFANPHIADPLSRLSGRGSTKMPAYLLPSLREARQQGRPYAALSLVVAMWLRYLRGTDLDGRPLEVQDSQAAELQELAIRGGSDPRPLLSRTDIFGDLGCDGVLVAALEALLVQLDRDGMTATLSAGLTRQETESASHAWSRAGIRNSTEGDHYVAAS